ncbi:conserved hypothetical protein [Magnetococcus marinus MC-1]|uniref:Gamma-glutamylcyclotransferase AIG2-like domain-containing protein n=1 Tax=Magnetococcus marinus (strain ATCC BAA-1437 / JCM 17883 / MC-1) TaxID=156889 RepID=A0LA96_MAGMM|nr:gamma-glutamylcyclotransferase family protein [Magnetococcus marinus]ABK44889.1 conserved hypothetical protein [Magnetococcus marinus MC-1]
MLGIALADLKMRTFYYLAYGSNLNRAHMAQRCGAAQPVGWCLLQDWQLCFRYWADVQPAPGCHVYGGLYRITPGCEKALDLYEEFPSLYDKRYTTVEAHLYEQPIQPLPVMFYCMRGGAYQAPDAAYLAEITQGMIDFNFPLDALQRAAGLSLS